MQSINALSFAPAVNNCLANSHQPRILHIFDHACNLINEHKEILSIVTPQIGNGPFNLVIEDDVLFPEHLNLQSPVSASANQLTLGNITIHTTKAKLWSPRPDWESLYAKKEHIIKLLLTNYQARGLDMGFAIAQPYSTTTFNSQFPNSLTSSLVNADLPSSLAAAQKLAGLGIGLTPSGDDFIFGAVLAAWVIHPLEIASVLAKEITNTAAPLTTALSAAWLRSAGRGEAGILWHNFFNALTIPASNLQSPVSRLLSVGHTSGADALSGFIGTFISYAEYEAKPCPS